MVGGDVVRALGLPGADGREQVAVLVDAVEEVRQAVEDEVPDAQRQVEVALDPGERN